MFVGHYAVALAAKRYAPDRSLGMGFLAVQWLDVVWAPFILLGIEKARVVPGFLPASALDLYYMPWTHSLVLALAWSLAFWAVTRSKVLGACVFSHWLLDLVAHKPDMPLYPGGAAVGLGLWYSRTGTAVVETALVIVGLALYLKATRARKPAGRWAIFLLSALLIAINFANLYGPPPPNMTLVAVMGESGYLLFAGLALMTDRLREPRSVAR